MFYNNMEKPELYAIEDQFYLGDYILVAPVTEAGADKRKVYLPEGTWVNMWTKECFDGKQTVVCDAPKLKKEGLPMFIKVGGGVAYQPDCMSLYDCVPEELRVELYADTEAELLLNENETVTNRFTCGKDGDTFEVFAENNSNVDRKYTVAIYSDGKEYTSAFNIGAGSHRKIRMK